MAAKPDVVRASVGTLLAAPAHGDRRGGGDQRAVDPRSRVPNVGPLLEGHRSEAEVQGRHLAVGVAAEYDGRGAWPKPGEIDAEGVRVVAVRVEAKALAHRMDRHLPPTVR